MDAAVQAFKDKTAEKAEAKQKALVAVGEAKLAEHEGRDASQFWATVAQFGMDGVEGRCHAELQAMADAYVEAHPEQFVNVEQYATPEGNEQIVKLISLMSKSGMEEEALKLTMFELAKFDRQTFGATPRATVRMAGG